MTPNQPGKPVKMCNVEGCDLPARFQVGFIAPFKRVIVMQTSMTKEFQMWLALGVCGRHRLEIKTIEQLLNEEQINMTNANMAKQGMPPLDLEAGFVMFDDHTRGAGHPDKVTRADGQPLGRKLEKRKVGT